MVFPVSSQSKRPFSQLEFDKKPGSQTPKEEKLKLIFGETDKKEKNSLNQIEDAADDKSNDVAKVMTKFGAKEYKLEGPVSFIVPRLKGPITDEGSNIAITSKASWPFRKGAFCKVPIQEDNLCKKSLALKEVLGRYTANDDFYNLACIDHECPENKIAALTSLSLLQTSEGTLSMNIVGKACRYYMQKGTRKNWVLLKADKAICSCLPTSCHEL